MNDKQEKISSVPVEPIFYEDGRGWRIADLRKYGFRNIHRVLGNEPDRNALGANQTHDLLHLFEQSLYLLVYLCELYLQFVLLCTRCIAF